MEDLEGMLEEKSIMMSQLQQDLDDISWQFTSLTSSHQHLEVGVSILQTTLLEEEVKHMLLWQQMACDPPKGVRVPLYCLAWIGRTCECVTSLILFDHGLLAVIEDRRARVLGATKGPPN